MILQVMIEGTIEKFGCWSEKCSCCGPSFMKWMVKGIPCSIIRDLLNSSFTEHPGGTVSNNAKDVAK